jgi:GH15 family glucan-1,4-alpha-glucosidase
MNPHEINNGSGPSRAQDAVNPLFTALKQQSIQAILENQNADGAIIASPDFTQYHYSWLRDGSFIAFALDLAGEHEASSKFHSWVTRSLDGISDSIEDVIEKMLSGQPVDPQNMPPARFSLTNSSEPDDWPNFQIDGYGTWLWALGKHLEIVDAAPLSESLRTTVERVARYVSAYALSPCYDVWEESRTGLHSSTLACVYGGLNMAARLLGNDDYLLRASEVAATIRESSHELGRYVKSNESSDVDSSLLWLGTPFGVVSSTDEVFSTTVREIEDVLTLNGGLRRYPTDVYFGSGAWPVLTGSLGWHFVATGNISEAIRCRDWIAQRFDDTGRLGEQFFGEVRDPKNYSMWVDRWGPPAKDLVWSHAMFVILCTEIESALSATDASRDVRQSINEKGGELDIST